MKALLIGFGDLAQRLTPQLIDRGWQVSGLRRSEASFPGVEIFSGDCRDPGLLRSALKGQNLVVVTMTPDQFSDEGYRKAYVESAMALAEVVDGHAIAPEQVLWVSSTGVYGQNDGEWVDEASETRPESFSGRRLLEAERVISSLPVANTVVRFSGIYGPGRSGTINKIRSGICAPATPVKWSNRIHSDDCAGVLCHFAMLSMGGERLAGCYLATDCEPAPLHEVHQWIAQRLGCSVEAQEKDGAARSNRRCSNKCLLSTGYRFLYPTYREGYGDLINKL